MNIDRTRVLDVAPFGVIPPVHGGSLRIFHICQYLSQHYDITLFSQGSAQMNLILMQHLGNKS